MLRYFSLTLAAALAAGLLFGAGCGRIADKDRIRIAKVGDTYITRGDLWRAIREMDDEDRPRIERRADLRRFLEQYIDDMIKAPLGEALDARLTEAQRNVMMAQAREVFFARRPDIPYREIARMEVPETGELPPAAQQYNLTPQSIFAMQDALEFGAEKIYAKLIADAAVTSMALENYRGGQLAVSDEDLRREYNLMRDELLNFEWMEFKAIRFPVGTPGAEAEAASVRSRLDAGESFDAIAEEFAARDPERVFVSEIENNPDLVRFHSFWFNASESEPGDIIGPVYLPEYTQAVQTADGRQASREMPASYLILRVLQHRPQEIMSIEEAREHIIAPVAFAKQMQALREQQGVEIYEENLPDPGGFTGGFVEGRPGF